MNNDLELIKTLVKESKRARAKMEKAVSAFIASKAAQSDNGMVKIRQTSVEDHEGTEIALVTHANVNHWGEAEFYDKDDQKRLYPFYLRDMDDDSILRLVKKCK